MEDELDKLAEIRTFLVELAMITVRHRLLAGIIGKGMPYDAVRDFDELFRIAYNLASRNPPSRLFVYHALLYIDRINLHPPNNLKYRMLFEKQFTVSDFLTKQTSFQSGNFSEMGPEFDQLVKQDITDSEILMFRLRC